MDHPAIQKVPLQQIVPSPRNPRRTLKQVEELAASLATYGLLQPIVLRQLEDGTYEVVAGHRRLAAAQELGWSKIPAVFREANDDEAFLLTVIENLQRSDLSPREEAAALEVLVRERGWSTRQVGEAVHRSNAYVSRRLRVFDDPILAPLVLQRRLGVSIAEMLLPLPPTKRKRLAEQAAADGWNRRQMRAAIDDDDFDGDVRQPSVQRRAREFRSLIHSISPTNLSEADRRELRLLFRDLALLAKAPAAPESVVVPPLIVPRVARE